MIRRLILALLFSILLTCTTDVLAANKRPAEESSVIAKGEASTSDPDARENAIAAALRAAVRARVGTYVDSTTLVENAQVISDSILVKTSGFAVLDSVEATSVRNGVLTVTVKATVSNRPLAEKLRELGLTHEWKIGVFIPEAYVSKPKPVPDPAAETAVIQRLLKAGYRVMDESQRKQLRDDESNKRALSGDLKALSDIKREYDVDIFVTGEAFSEYVDEAQQGGVTFYRCRGRLELRAYYTDTGELISMVDGFSDGLDQTESLSSKQCFKSLGLSAGQKIADDLLIAPAALTPFVTVKLANVKTATQASTVEKALKTIAGVKQVKRQRLSSGMLELNVFVNSESRDALPERIENCKAGKDYSIVIKTWSKTFLEGSLQAN